MIDAHHHIWEQRDLPWLLGPEQPRIFGAYGSIRRDYLVDEYLSDIRSSGIEKSVYIQANWAPTNALGEVAWVEKAFTNAGWEGAIVAFADFTVSDVRPQLDALSQYKSVRGIRQQYHWHQNPTYRFAPNAKQLVSDNVMANLGYLTDYNWSFDLQIFEPQMADASTLITHCPNVNFILQHSGMLEDQSTDGIAKWEHGMRRLASHPNVFNKLSGLGTFVHRNDPEFIAQTVTKMIEIFGADRCMFGSNFPIEKIWTSYGQLFDAYKAATSELTPQQQRAIFSDTASRIYRL